MPIEIKELQIKINVSESSAGETSSGGGVTNTNNESIGDKELIIQECVDKVLEILRNKVER